MRRQNEKLALDLKKAKGEWVELESIKREVLAANAVVKSQLLSLPFRLGSQLASIANPRECSLILVKAIEECLNDLAYSRETPPETCPTCGAGVEKRS